jgi:hypothetical protein
MTTCSGHDARIRLRTTDMHEAHLFSQPLHDEDLLTQQRGEILPKQWQNVTQKVGKVLSHFLLRF